MILFPVHPADIYLLKVNNINNGTRCEIYLNLIIKTPTRMTPMTSF